MDQQPPDYSGLKESTVPRGGSPEQKEQEFLVRKMDRDNKMEATLHLCKRALLVVSFAIIILFILTRVFILIAPESWIWLSHEQVSSLDEFFVHGTIGAIVAGYLGKYLKEGK